MIDVEQDILGFTTEGEPVILYTLTNTSGARVKLINIGAAVVSIEVPDNKGKMRDVVLGYRVFDDYIRDTVAMGKTVGRCAGRIGFGKFTLDEKEYRLPLNSGNSHFNGGSNGFQTKVWGARVEGDDVVFSYQSPDGEEGYPNTLGVEVTYSWNDNSELRISYMGKPSGETIVNLTNSTYFNLNGECSGDILGHNLEIYADCFLPVKSNMLPTGEVRNVDGTAMDFRVSKAIGKDIEQEDSQLEIGNGYDHCWALRNWQPGVMMPNCKLYSPQSEIVVTVSSTQAGLYVYTANSLYGTGVSKCGKEHDIRQGVSLQCQNYPNAINNPNFPTVILREDEIYDEQIMFSFSIINKPK